MKKNFIRIRSTLLSQNNYLKYDYSKMESKIEVIVYFVCFFVSYIYLNLIIWLTFTKMSYTEGHFKILCHRC